MKKSEPITIQQVLLKAAQKLTALLRNQDRAWAEAEMLLGHAFKRDRTWTLAHSNEKISAARCQAFERLLNRRLKHEPMAYLLGHATFFGRDFRTDKRALIPRYETEDLVRRALDSIKTSNTLVWDAGVGSGAIAVSVKASMPQVRVVASDVSPSALAVAKINARKILGNGSAIEFKRADLLSPSLKKNFAASPHETFLVLANLPYLPLTDKKKLMPDVVKYEPSRALFTREDGNYLLHRLMVQLESFQKKDGRSIVMLAEFDPPQAKKLLKLAQQTFPHAHVAVHQDDCGRDRILEIRTN